MGNKIIEIIGVCFLAAGTLSGLAFSLYKKVRVLDIIFIELFLIIIISIVVLYYLFLKNKNKRDIKED